MTLLLSLFVVCIHGYLTHSFIFDGVTSNVAYFFVSPHGSDSNPGMGEQHPFKTIQHALDMLKKPDLAKKDIVINLLQGYHSLTSTLTIPQTSGRKVKIQAYQNRQVHVTGGKQIPSNKFHRVTDSRILHRLSSNAQQKVVQVKLSDVGITNLGVMKSIGGYHTRHAPLEVFYNGEPLRLAQYPNKEYLNVLSMPDGHNGKRFTTNTDRLQHWTSESDIWAYGFWYWSWSDTSIKIQSVDPKSKTITLNEKPYYGFRIGHYDPNNITAVGYANQGGYFRVINALCELDQPGEYYVDRTSGILYMWPPSGDQHVHGSDVIYASIIDTCIRADRHIESVTIQGFTLESCRLFGLQIKSGSNITVQSMEIKNTGTYNLYCISCTYSTITKSYFHDGDGGININGGDRDKLIPSHNVISDNRIWCFSRVAAVGYHGIFVSGVAGHVHHNHIYFGQYTAIWWNGNDHLIEYNHVHHNCMNATDCGGMHTGRDWTMRGNVIRKNYVHHMLRLLPGADVRGIMLDDQYSSVTIENNVFFDNEVHVNIGGGRDNIVRENIFYNATKSSMQVDSRGIKGTNDVSLFTKLHAVPYKSSLWASRYPKLAHAANSSFKYPVGNQIYDNIFMDTTKIPINWGSKQRSDWFNVTENSHAIGTQDFLDAANYDFQPTCFLAQTAKSMHFPTPIPISQVGPRYQIGPTYLGMHPIKFQTRKSRTHACTTHAPSTVIPKSPYLSDGSVSKWSQSTSSAEYNLPKQGCWLRFENCPNNSSLEGGSLNHGFHRDVDGEKSHGTGTSESACLERVKHYISLCGAKSAFTVVYGPTGAMTLGGEGCFMADYGCPKHEQSHTNHGRMFRDGYAERTHNASFIENNCLSRAYAQYVYCGSDPNYPITSIFRPTGHSITIGGGCWIKLDKCPKHPSASHFFYDNWGATNYKSDIYESVCFDRAKSNWQYCGSDHGSHVTAIFRPTGKQHTYP